MASQFALHEHHALLAGLNATLRYKGEVDLLLALGRFLSDIDDKRSRLGRIRLCRHRHYKNILGGVFGEENHMEGITMIKKYRHRPQGAKQAQPKLVTCGSYRVCCRLRSKGPGIQNQVVPGVSEDRSGALRRCHSGRVASFPPCPEGQFNGQNICFLSLAAKAMQIGAVLPESDAAKVLSEDVRHVVLALDVLANLGLMVLPSATNSRIGLAAVYVGSQGRGRDGLRWSCPCAAHTDLEAERPIWSAGHAGRLPHMQH
eukprot:4855596-Pleurochrysis_carterae.AAC.2